MEDSEKEAYKAIPNLKENKHLGGKLIMKTVFENENGIIKVDDFGAYIINAKNGNFEVANSLEKAIRILEKISK